MEQDIKTIRKEQPLMVTIRCITYNHEPYIRQCLEGFVMQKTNFRFEAIVHDDASTDGTADIIREYAEKYPDIIKPIYETENQYSKHDGSLDRIMNEHTHGKYVAICEGDDYWIDPLKLQKQVDYLEANPEYGLVHGAAKVFYQSLNAFRYKTFGGDFSSADDLIVSNRVVTLTACYRRDLYLNYLRDIDVNQGWKMQDYPLWIYLSLHSKTYFFSDVMAVYRYLDNSASHSVNVDRRIDFLLSVYSVKKYFINKYNKTYLLRKCQIDSLNNIEISYILSGEKVDVDLLRKNGMFVNLSLKSYLLYLISNNSYLRKLYLWKIRYRNTINL